VDVGRGLLEALGVGAEVGPGDVAARGNYCTLDAAGRLVDRRAGRIATEESRPITASLGAALRAVEDVKVEVHAGLQHRFSCVFRGPGLSSRVADTDPQDVGVPPLPPRPLDPSAAKTARVAEALVAAARRVLGKRDRANAVLLRGFSGRPTLPTLAELARLRACAVAAYPAYRGVARLLGMEIVDGVGPTSTIADEVGALENAWTRGFDFFFLHVKGTDSAGEDGDEARKAGVIEAFDKELPRLRALRPDALVITGDHSTPGPMAGHSWHAVPSLVWGPWCEPDGLSPFDEAQCRRGSLGSSLPATALLRLALANAGKLAKYGA
jgi:2,3-bisphosphoglycerate-independent phosphoglycerate mutase